MLDEGIALNALDPRKQAFADLLRVSAAELGANRASLSAEAKAAMAAKTGVMALKAGDGFYGYGDYAKAADLYRAAITKGGVDSTIAQLHLGMALARAGDRRAAEAAFRAVRGPRADLARLWLTWLPRS